jgi:hypothetical protein
MRSDAATSSSRTRPRASAHKHVRTGRSANVSGRDLETAMAESLTDCLRAIPDGTGRDAAAITPVVRAIGITMPVAIAIVMSVTGNVAVAPVVVTPPLPVAPSLAVLPDDL